MRVRRSTTPMGRRIVRLELALSLAVIVVLGGIGYYRAVHFDGNERFSHCTIVSDAILVLNYSFGVGDEVVTFMRPEEGDIVVGLRVHGDGGTHILIELAGRVEYLLHSGFEGRRVVYEDGKELNCRHSNKMPNTF